MGEGLALFGGHQGFGGVLFQQLLVGSEIPKKGAQRGGFPLACGRHVVPVVRHVVHKGIDFIGGHRADKLQVRVLHLSLIHICREYLAGNLAFLEENHQPATLEERSAAKSVVNKLAQEGKTPLLFLRDGKLLGVIAVADTIRETSRAAIQRFNEMGLHVVMLTGDNKVTAEAIRKELGIEQAISDVLPTQKEAHIRSLQEEGHKVAMVGDGINDAPALTRADIGIAIGAGTDIAIESADVVLMKDSLDDVAVARCV